MLYAMMAGILMINLIILFRLRDVLKMQNISTSGDQRLIEALERLKAKEIIEEDLYQIGLQELTHSSKHALENDEKIVMEFLYEKKLIDAIVLDEYATLVKKSEI